MLLLFEDTQLEDSGLSQLERERETLVNKL